MPKNKFNEGSERQTYTMKTISHQRKKLKKKSKKMEEHPYAHGSTQLILCKWLHYLKHSILPVLLPSKFQ
jgi:hypothetical protein